MRKGIGVSPGVVVRQGVLHPRDLRQSEDPPPGRGQNLRRTAAATTQRASEAAAELHALYQKVTSQVGTERGRHLSGPRVDPARSDVHGQNPPTDRRRSRDRAEALEHACWPNTRPCSRARKDEYHQRAAGRRPRRHHSPVRTSVADPAPQDPEGHQRSADARGQRTAALAGRDAGQSRSGRHRDASRRPDQPRGDSGPQPRRPRRQRRGRHSASVKNGDTVVVDGSSGHVLVNPDAETESAYLKLQREFFDLKDALAENRDLPAVTARRHHRSSCWPTSTTWTTPARPPRPWAPSASDCSAPSTCF